ncbi:MAG: phosphoribosylformylglycinamidine synthase subunit PurQ [Ilumatobacteraceae bacterium]
MSSSRTGRPVIGICNGFQVLTRTKLLPGALGHNAHGRFECRWVVLDPAAVALPLDEGDRAADPLPDRPRRGSLRPSRPRRAGRGRTDRLYLPAQSTNPNGSVADIAGGVRNASGNVLGLMPHPENFVIGRQHPHFRSGGGLDHLGLQLFRNGVAAAEQM